MAQSRTYDKLRDQVQNRENRLPLRVSPTTQKKPPHDGGLLQLGAWPYAVAPQQSRFPPHTKLNLSNSGQNCPISVLFQSISGQFHGRIMDESWTNHGKNTLKPCFFSVFSRSFLGIALQIPCIRPIKRPFFPAIILNPAHKRLH